MNFENVMPGLEKIRVVQPGIFNTEADFDLTPYRHG